MEQESKATQDPASGYASADVLDPAAEVNHHREIAEGPEQQRDPMSGYASADLLDPAPSRTG